MEEIFDVFDINGNFLGTKPKSFCHSSNPGVYHKPVWIWIVNKDKILVQKRALVKKNHPGKWDMPSAGHVDAGETILQGCVRETFEELGLKTNESDYIFLGEYLAQDAWEFGQVFLLRTNAEIKDLTLQVEEVEQVKYLDFDGFKKLFNSNEFCPYKDDYKNWICEILEKECENGRKTSQREEGKAKI